MNRFQNCLAPRGRGNVRGYLFHCVRAMQIAAIAGLTSIALPNLAEAAVTGVLITTGTSVAPTGSAPFNGLPANIMPTADACTAGNNSTYTPGNDPCGSDLIIRTNDDVTYNIQYVTSGADTVTITSVLPTNNGTPIADWKSLPPQCTGAGSGISADGQTLTCIISVSASATASILPQATVRGTTPNGTSFPIPATTVSAAGGLAPGFNGNANVQAGSTTAPLTVSAAPLYDVQKGAGAMQYATGPDGTTPGWLLSWSIAVRVPYGPKGLESLSSAGLTMTDAMAGITVLPSNPTVQAALRAQALLYQSVPWTSPAVALACAGNFNALNAYDGTQAFPSVNGTSTGGYTLSNADNGVCTATQPGNAPGGDISIALTGVNWTNPNPVSKTIASLGQSLLPYGQWVASNRLAVWVPATVFNGVAGQLQIGNALTQVAATSITGQPIVQPSVPDLSLGGTANDSTSFNTPVFGGGPGFEKRYQDYSSATLGIAPYIHAQNGVATPGQVYASALYTFNNNSADPIPGLTVCDKIDNTKNIATETTPGGGAVFLAVYSGVRNLVPGTDYTVEYGTGGLSGAGSGWANPTDFASATCADDQSPIWYSTLAAVPGGAQMVTKVRVHFLAPVPPTYLVGAYLTLQNTSPSLVAGMGAPAGTLWPAGTKINNWGAFATSALPAGTLGNDDGVSKYWTTGSSLPSAYLANGGVNSNLGDTVNQGYATVRIAKGINGITDSSGNIIPAGNIATAVVAGNTIFYNLAPTLSSANSGSATSVQVKDILPPYLSYVAGSASLVPSSVQNNTPATGYTTIIWDIASVTPNTTIAPITYQALSTATGPNGESLPNFAVISSPADPGTCISSGGIYDGILNVGYAVAADDSTTGTLCLRASQRNLTLSSPPGFSVAKVVDKSQIEPNNSFTYTLSWISIGSQVPVIDLIDVLPFAGDGRTPATVYAGTRTLAPTALAVSGDAAATFWYTTTASASIVTDPAAASNGAFGAPGGIWTACPSNICPSNATGIRMLSGTALQNSTVRSFTVTINTANNVPGNVYTNNFVTRGTGLANAVTANSVNTTVVLGSLAGSVYSDINNDGVKAASGEAGIGNVKVCVSGGNLAGPVCQQTAADGSYTFTNLYAGSYVLIKYNDTTNSPGLAGYVDGKETAGTLGGTLTSSPANDVISAIVMPIGATSSGYLFGELPVGTISVTKTVNGLPSATGWTFTLSSTTPGCTIAASTNNPATTPSGSNVSVSFANVPVYSTISTAPCQYSVAETAQSGYQLNASQSSALTGVTVTTGGTTALNVQNDQLYGSLQVTKNLSGGPLGTSGNFPITAACLFNGNTVTGITPSATQSVAATTGGSGQVTFANIPQGATCTVSEGAFPKAPLSYTYDAASITQPTSAVSATPITAVVNNHLTQQFGVLAATKSVSGSPAGYTDTFTLSASCSLSGTAVTGILPAASQTVTAGTGTTGTATFTNIPQGATCTVAEAAQPTANLPVSYSWIGPPSITQPAAAISAVPATALVVNTMQLQVAGLTVVKTVTGGPNGYGDSFPVSVACTFQNAAVTGITPSATQTVSATNTLSGSVNFDGIPLGAICTVTEGTLPAPPLSYQWATPTITQASAIAAAGSTATVANALSQQFGSLVVSKTVTGGPAVYSDSFPITASCSLSGTDVSGAIVPSATQSVSAGTGSDGTLTFANIPQGSICTISEGALPTAPAGGYLWNTPQVTQPAAAISATPGTAGIANSMSLDPPFHLIKTVTGGPSTLNGSFTFNIDCGAVGKFTQTVVLSNALSGSVAISNLPAGSSCTFSEASVLPLAPNGFDWDALPPAQTKVIDGSDVTFINTLVASLPADPTLPDPIPALRDFTLAVLALLLLGVGARVLDQREVPRRRRKLDR